MTMFQTLTERLSSTVRRLTGRDKLRKEDIEKALSEVREALLAADVALSVVKDFIHAVVKEKAMGQTIGQHLSPAQRFIQIVHQELIAIMGQTQVGLHFNMVPPACILMVGLQGSGKTTTTAKLAKWVQHIHQKSVLVVSVDVYRPAAIQQLKILAETNQIAFFESSAKEAPLSIVQKAVMHARKHAYDVLLIDTAGRLHSDSDRMDELKCLQQSLNPIETLLVLDSMAGQDALQTAQIFNKALTLTGVVLTKTDGDARGGVALSVRHVTDKPIKFIGTSEHIDGLEPFHPDRAASRILGMGDMLGLIEEMGRKADKEKTEKLANKLTKGHGFDLNDLRDQVKQMLTMGGMAALLDKLPTLGLSPQTMRTKINDVNLVRTLAILDSMTLRERRFPDILNGQRKQRIAFGSGSSIQAVNGVLKQYSQMQKTMKKLTNKNGMARLVQNLQGHLPPNASLS